VDVSAFDIDGCRAVVVGAARSGVAAAELLARRGARVVLSEQRQEFDGAERMRELGVSLELGGHGSKTFDEADLVVVSPGVTVDLPLLASARARGIEVIGELELAARWINGRLIAITGTKGKSTTTTLVGRMLEAAGLSVLVGGNIGMPLSAQVDVSTPSTVHVVEASSFQLETTTTLRPWIAAWLNHSDDHLDRHGSADAYASAKAKVFANQTSDDWAVLNADDAVVATRTSDIVARRVTFSLTGSADVTLDRGWITRRTDTGSERVVPVEAVEMPGSHMLADVLAAVAVASVAGAPPTAIGDALHGFSGLEHVMEPVTEFAGVRFVNDSKATNIEAARCSIESFKTGVVAILGGHFKGGDFTVLCGPLSARALGVVAIGEAASLVRDAVEGVVPVVMANSMHDAVERAFHLASPGGIVLLAPACASFGWFADWAERGRSFRKEVFALKARKEAALREL
jgi:UDP-N-acetylmuramoylalanine--D-glutamate ligase